MSIGGASSKCFLSVDGGLKGAYIAKFAHKNSQMETYTELFNNQLGKALGFQMAHSGIAKLDGVLHFLSRSFLNEGELLIHGSLMVVQLELAKKEEIESIKTINQQQGIYDVDFVEIVIKEFCGRDFETVFEKFVSMLVFDALIGSMDRHPRNWGVIRPIKGPERFNFAPIYDSARALLWDLSDARVAELLASDTELKKYIGKSSPRIGLPNATRRCNHFDLISRIAVKHKTLVFNSLTKLPRCTLGLTADLLQRWPFRTLFAGVRKRAIMRIIDLRYRELMSIKSKGGNYVQLAG